MLNIGTVQITSMEKFSKEKYSLAFLMAVLLIRIILKPEYFPGTPKTVTGYLELRKIEQFLQEPANMGNLGYF